MSRHSFEIVYGHLESCRELQMRQYPGGREEIPIEKAVLMGLEIFRFTGNHIRDKR